MLIACDCQGCVPERGDNGNGVNKMDANYAEMVASHFVRLVYSRERQPIRGTGINTHRRIMSTSG